MPGVLPTLGSSGSVPSMWVAVIQQINGVAALAAGTAGNPNAQQLDQYQNSAVILGGLNQVVTIGAGFFATTCTTSDVSNELTAVGNTTGIEPGMNLVGIDSTIPSGATVTAVGPSSVTIDKIPGANQAGVTILVGSRGGVQVGTGLAGFGIAYATNFSYTTLSATDGDATAILASPFAGAAGTMIGANGAITPGTWIEGSGTTVNLSQPAFGTVVDEYCATCTWTSLSGPVTPTIMPVVTAIAPSSGPAAGGSTVLVTGTGFAQATLVSFGPRVGGTGGAATFTVVSDTQIVCVSPPGSPSNLVDVTVSSGLGTSPTGNADQFYYA